jgi:hypothetical protein
MASSEPNAMSGTTAAAATPATEKAAALVTSVFLHGTENRKDAGLA